MAELRRSLGLWKITLMGVGVILGAGIYALVGKAAALSGNAVWISFLIAALIASLTGLSYAELSSFIPKAGGEYYYAQRAFGKFYAFLLSWLLIIGLSIAAGAVALGFAGYFAALFHTDIVLTAIGLILVCTAALLYGTEQAAWIAVVGTLLEVSGVLIVIAIGIPKLGSVDYFQMAGHADGIVKAAALIFFAFIGFDEVVQLAEESNRPEKDIPRAVLLSIIITAVLYILVAIASISVMGWAALGASNSPLADVAGKTLGSQAFFLLSIIALFSTGNTVLLIILSSARLLYGMAEGGSMPSIFARVHRRRQTPHIATVSIAIVSIIMVYLLQRIEVIARVSNFTFFVTFILVNLSVIVLRFKEPDAPRAFRIPFSIKTVPLIPVLGMIGTLIMLFNLGWYAFGMGSLILLIGIVVYLLLNR